MLAACATEPPYPEPTTADALGQLAYGWNAEIVARVDQSYAGWDVEVGDADGDGALDILTGTAPDSRLELHRKTEAGWQTNRLVNHLAGKKPGMVLGVRVVDLDHDGRPEVLAGTGQEDDTIAQLAILQTDGASITSLTSLRAPDNTSSYTHGMPTADLDGDGMDEIISSYCGNGEVIRYDVDDVHGPLRSRKLIQLTGSGEDARLLDVDNDGDLELVVSNGFRDRDARIQIYDLDPVTGDPRRTPRITLDQLEGERMFYASMAAGDLDGDGRPELIVGWKHEQDVNRATLVAYHVEGAHAVLAYILARDEPLLDLGYFEKMMEIGDLDGDGRNELVVSTRGDAESEGIDSDRLGHVYAYRVLPTGDVRRDLIIDFDERYVESSWLAMGDADNDGHPDLVLATGKGNREEPGLSWVLRLWHAD
jgi:hypothetical protein